ncbi:restriction endonuclease subunit S [Ruminococcus bromii]|uniref:restriction endonuclease subunit S n=1 Tax=Ruminococcus bromii TaxID=40518 RepID=UPI0039773032|nr:restriction endonuclease subunit S [Ruminococcus bromii]
MDSFFSGVQLHFTIDHPTLSEIEIYISKNVAEQKQIAEFFTSLDNLITLHQREPT